MTTIPHESAMNRERPTWSRLLITEAWASLAITAMWMSVLFTAIFGPDIESYGVAGDHTIVPSAVPVAVFAFFATWVVARYGFRHDPKS